MIIGPSFRILTVRSATWQLAEELRAKVHRKTRLTCSAGVAPNRLLAKVGRSIGLCRPILTIHSFVQFLLSNPLWR